MSESQPPKSIEEILSLLGDLARRMDQMERQIHQVLQPGAAAQRPPAVPPPLPPAAARLAQPAAPTPPGPAEEPILLQADPSAAVRPARAQPAAPPAAPEPGARTWQVPLKKPEAPAGQAPERSLEQILGTKWLLIAGVALLLLGGGFFFQYALRKGWINPPTRCVMGTIMALVVIGLGEWAFRRKMKLFAAGLFGVGVVWLYYTGWAASPNGPYYPEYQMISRPVAFAVMCVVTLLGVGLSIRADMLTGGLIALVGALATPLLLSSGRDQQVALMSYLLVVNVGFLVLAAVKRWEALAPLALGGTAVLFGGWYFRFYGAGALARTSAFAWALFALFGAYAVAATRWKRTHPYVGIALMAAGGGLLAVLWPGMDLPDGALLAHVAVLEAIVLGACLLMRWQWLRFGLLGWTAWAVVMQWLVQHDTPDAALALTWSGWIWLLFGLLTADVLVRTFSRRFETNRTVDAVVSTVGMGAMFAATYGLLEAAYHAWLGLYTASLGAAAICLWWAIGRVKARRVPAYAYLGQGLVLIVLAVPIQFEKFTITIAWGVMGVVAMLLARLLRSSDRAALGSGAERDAPAQREPVEGPIWVLALVCVVVLGLALIHFIAADLPRDPRMGEALVRVFGVTVTTGLALAVGLAAAFLASVAILRAGEAIMEPGADGLLAGLMLAAGVLLFAVRTAWELSAVTATWWWLALAGGMVAVGLWRRSDRPAPVEGPSGWLSGVAGCMVLGTALKWLLHDTLWRRVNLGADLERVLVVNWQFLAGVAAAAILLIQARLLRTRRVAIRLDVDDLAPALGAVGLIVGALLIVWGGSFEVDRYLVRNAARFEDPVLAEHMALSLWWAVYAAVLLTVGFLKGAAPLRYLAMIVFAVTIGKVFIMDMRGVEAVYRILSFLGLGAVLLAASLLYHRFFRPSTSPGRAALGSEAEPEAQARREAPEDRGAPDGRTGGA